MAEKRKPGRPKKRANAGRPTVMTAETLKKLEYAFLKGMSDREACLFANISAQSLYNYCNENPAYFERKELLKEMPKVQAKINVVEGIENGDTELSKWYLERRNKEEFSTKQDIGLTGTVNNPFEGFTTDELKKLIESE